MPLSITLDTVKGSALDISTTTSRIIRGGIAQDLDLTDGNEDNALYQILTSGLLPVFGSLHPRDERFFFNRLLVDPEPRAKDKARLRLVYETVRFDGPPSAWILRRHGYMTSEQTNIIRGNINKPLMVGFNPPGGLPTGSSKVPPEPILFNVLRPKRAISAHALRYGAPPAIDPSTCEGFVNDATFYGRAKGHWMLIEGDITESLFAGYHSIDVTIAADGKNDWSLTGILRNQTTGRFVEVSPAILAAYLAEPYEEGPIPSTDTTYMLQEGFIRWGPYPVADFTAFADFGL